MNVWQEKIDKFMEKDLPVGKKERVILLSVKVSEKNINFKNERLIIFEPLSLSV